MLGGVKNFSLGICDGAPSTARSSYCYYYYYYYYKTHTFIQIISIILVATTPKTINKFLWLATTTITDQLMVLHRTQATTWQQEYNYSEATSSFFLSQMIAKIEMTLRTPSQNKDWTKQQNLMGAPTNNEPITTESLLLNKQYLRPLRGLIYSYGQIFALDCPVIKPQKCLTRMAFS